MRIADGRCGTPAGARPASADENRRLRVTVAICTRARPEQLRRALESLGAQRVPPSEILVIDNAPEVEETRNAIARTCSSARYVVEPILGLDFARNRALTEAGGHIVAFLDDDAVASSSWVGSIRDVFERDPAVGVCTGRVEPLELRTAGQRLFEANGGYGRGTQRIRLPADAGRRLRAFRAPLIAWAVSIGNGTSLAVRRDYAQRLAGFDEALDLGDVLPGGGDLDMMWRMLQAGHALVYEPDALAWHEHRHAVSDAVAQIAGHQRALVAFLVKSIHQASGGRTRAEVFAFLCWRLLKPGARLARRLTGHDPLPASALLRVWRECWAGLAAYGSARRTAVRRRTPAGTRVRRSAVPAAADLSTTERLNTEPGTGHREPGTRGVES